MNERFSQPKSLSNCPSLLGKLSIIDILGPSGFLPFLHFGAILLHDLRYSIIYFWASPVTQVVKDLPAMQETQVLSLAWKYPWRREWLPTPVFLPGKSHGQRALAGTVHGVPKSWTPLSDYFHVHRPWGSSGVTACVVRWWMCQTGGSCFCSVYVYQIMTDT